MRNDSGGYTIEIKQSVYDGAVYQNIGAFLGFICHEICHVFLFEIGFVPVYEYSFNENTLPAYCSVEWQAKALCGEILMPYEETQVLSITEIMRLCKVSRDSAEKRKTY